MSYEKLTNEKRRELARLCSIAGAAVYRDVTAPTTYRVPLGGEFESIEELLAALKAALPS